MRTMDQDEIRRRMQRLNTRIATTTTRMDKIRRKPRDPVEERLLMLRLRKRIQAKIARGEIYRDADGRLVIHL